jgi:hypothetical protein
MQFKSYIEETKGLESTGQKDKETGLWIYKDKQGNKFVNTSKGKVAKWSPIKGGASKKASGKGPKFPTTKEELTDLAQQMQDWDDAKIKKYVDASKGKIFFNKGSGSHKMYLNVDKPGERGGAIEIKGKNLEKIRKASGSLASKDDAGGGMISGRSAGSAFKIETGSVEKNIAKFGGFKGDPTKELQSSLKNFRGKEKVKLQKHIEVMEELGHSDAVGGSIDSYFDSPKEYKKQMHGISLEIMKNTTSSYAKKFGGESKKATAIIKKMEKDMNGGSLTEDKLAKYYQEMQNSLPAEHQGAFGNNVGEMFAIQAEIERGDYVVIPTAGNAKLGDKVSLFTRNKPTDKPIVIAAAQGSVKKEDNSTVGAQHSALGVIEGCDFEGKGTKISGLTGMKYLFGNTDLLGDKAGPVGKASTKVYLTTGSPNQKLLAKAGIKNIDYGDKKQVDQSAQQLADFVSNPKNSKTVKNALFEDTGFNSPEMKKERKVLQKAVKDNGGLDGLVSVFMGSSGKEDTKSRVSKNALNALITGKGIENLSPKEMQMAGILSSITQKRGENFTYDVVGTKGDSWELKKGYAQDKSGETIHKVGGSYVLGMLLSYDFNPRVDKGNKYLNIGKRSVPAINKRIDKYGISH